MPKIAVEIEWDWQEGPFRLTADDVAVALQEYCKDTRFTVRDVEQDAAIKPSYAALCQRLPEKVVSEIHQAIGQASTCWEHLNSAGRFDSEQAGSIASDLCNFIADFLEEVGPELIRRIIRRRGQDGNGT